MSKKEQNELLQEILKNRRKNQNEAKILEAVLTGYYTLPFFFTRISFKQFLKFREHLTQFGIKSSYVMNTGRGDATWVLEPNALSDYLIKKRKETLDAIIYS